MALPYIDLVNETLEHFVTHRLTLHDFHGHTTHAAISSEELCASPQFVQDSAYATLKSALFPLKLPFNRPLELSRLYFQTLGAPLYSVMAALERRTGEAGGAYYGLADILMERVGLSRMEHRLLTDDSLTLTQLFGLPGHSGATASPHEHGHAHAHADKSHEARTPHAQEHDGAEIAELSHFQHFCRRVGVSYNEMAEIVRTRFVNPDTGIAARVEALGLGFEVIQLLKAGAIPDADFKELLPADLDPVAYGAHSAASKHDYGPVIAWIRNDANYARIMGLIIISKADDSDEGCSAANLRLCRANPDPAHHELKRADFVRILRFIRLWRKLGLSIELTDAALSALHPKRTPQGHATNSHASKGVDAAFVTLLSRLGYLLQAAELLSLTPERDLQPLLACWGPIESHGRKSLYRKMFLSPSLLHKDDAFQEDPSGDVLAGNSKLFEHEPALCSALHLRGPEFNLIAEALGFDKTTPLTLENVSDIFRRGWLARTLHISVVELLALVQCTGLNPFAPLDPEPTAAKAASDVVPAAPMIRFVRLVQALRNASVKPTQALYLLWNRDISGKSAPPERVVNDLARTLRANFQEVEGQFALVDDPKGEIAKGLMTLVYGSDATEFFFSLLEGTFDLSVPYAAPLHELSEAVVGASQGRLVYDDLRKSLSFKGVLDEKTALPVLVAAAAGDDLLLKALSALAKKSHRSIDPFFARNPILLPLYTTYVASADPVQAKRKGFLAEILKDLRPRRKEEQALVTITAVAGSDASFARALLRDKVVLASAADAARAALADFTALENFGLTASFYSSNDPGGVPDRTEASAPLAYGFEGAQKNSAGSDGPLAAVWSRIRRRPENRFL